MTVRPAMNESGAPSWGSFALVTYLPDPLGSFLTELRHPLPGEARPDAHITFLPPRPLPMPLEDASLEIQRKAESFKPFELVLGTVQIFPETSTLYLNVESGYRELLQMHDSLNQGRFFAQEHFEYIPHLTLGGPLKSDNAGPILQHSRERWKKSGLSPRFIVKEMVLLWQPCNSSANEWNRVSAHPLAAQT